MPDTIQVLDSGQVIVDSPQTNQPIGDYAIGLRLKIQNLQAQINRLTRSIPDDQAKLLELQSQLADRQAEFTDTINQATTNGGTPYQILVDAGVIIVDIPTPTPIIDPIIP